MDFKRDEKKKACTWAELILKVNALGFSRQLDIQKKKIKDFNSFSLGLLFFDNSRRKGVFPLVSMLSCRTNIPRIK